jgi:protein-tyrosine-phosphatase
MDQVVLFVCAHGAGKSRMAAAFFNTWAPTGWRATTAGIEPQTQVSVHAPRLLAGMDAEARLDHERPRPISAVPAPARVVAIDCALAGADRWDLAHDEFDEVMRDEIRARVEVLARELAR